MMQTKIEWFVRKRIRLKGNVLKYALLEFWCNNFYPFCNIKKVKTDFTIVEDKNEFSGDRLEKVKLTKNEEINNNAIRKENRKILKEKGGIKKYLINWVAITILYSIVVFWLIQPETMVGRLPIFLINFIMFGGTFIMFIFYFFIDKGKE